MILYVNGDSHSAGAQAFNNYCFAKDDINTKHLGLSPHPDNLKVSYGNLIAQHLNADFHCEAESASSNDRILRTTHEYLCKYTPNLVIIGWATWEREEFLINGTYYQFSAGRVTLDWPKEIEQQYKLWVMNADSATQAQRWHATIWNFHQELLSKKINHLFFNTLHAFNHSFITKLDWGVNYFNPYSHNDTYYYWLVNNGYESISPNNYHFRADAHQAWANHLTKIINESIITK